MGPVRIKLKQKRELDHVCFCRTGGAVSVQCAAIRDRQYPVGKVAMTQRIALASLIQRALMGTLLWPIMLIFVLMLLLYLIFHSFLNFSFQSTLYDEIARYHLRQTQEQAQLMSARLEHVAQMARHLQREQQQFFQQPNAYPLPHGEPVFAVHENGAFYKSVDNGGSSLYYAATTAIGPAERLKARQTEVLDTGLRAVVDENPLVMQAYLNTWDNMNRLYPFMPNAPEQYGPAIEMESYNFYALAMAEHNPERKPVWTRAYLDPAGQGWMISCVVPIYRDAVLEGVTGLDITLQMFVQHLLKGHRDSQVGSFLLDQEGTVLAMNPSVERLLGLPEIGAHDYRQAVLSTVHKPDHYNLMTLQTEEVRSLFERIVQENLPSADVVLAGQRYFIAQTRIPETGWRLFSIDDGGKLFHSLTGLKQLGGAMLLIALLSVMLLVLISGLLIRRRLRRLAARLSNPIVHLARATEQLGTGHNPVALVPSRILEIDQLNRNFQTMAEELDSRTARLIQEEASRLRTEQEAERLRRSVVLDPLTGLYNRRKVDEVLEFEWQRSRRYGGGCALIMLDLDHFKAINDRCGHLVGDEVLRALATLLRQRVRRADLVSRWGGEEFLLICPDTDLAAAVSLAEQLRAAIAAYPSSSGERQTASFGVAELDGHSGSLAAVLDAVDQALYRAKSGGRNRVEVCAPKTGPEV